MKYVLALMITLGVASSATAHSENHRSAQWGRHHMTASAQNVTSSRSYADYLQNRKPGEGVIPIENQDLRGLLFVLGGLAGPAALLFATP